MKTIMRNPSPAGSQQPLTSLKPTVVSSLEGTSRGRMLARVERLAHLMDRRYIDPVMGFFLPGVGDVLGAAIGLYSVYLARKLGYSKVILARMIINLSVDSLVGSVPVLGSVFDLFNKAHLRNLALLQERRDVSPRPADWLILLGAAIMLLVAVTLPILLLILLVRAVF